MTMHRRMRSNTNFFLTNLAVADLCVSIFCVYQNFALYFIKDWNLGEFLCGMYHFINTLSYTASVIILVVVSGERYLAIVQPLRAKAILTRRNMEITVVLVWIGSALFSCPRFFYFKVSSYPNGNRIETMCIIRRDLFDSRLWDVFSLVFLYVVPLTFLTMLYYRIARTLCQSSKLIAQAANGECGTFTMGANSNCRPIYNSARTSQASYTESSSNHDAELDTHRSKKKKKTRGSVKSVLSSHLSIGSVKDDRSIRTVPEMIPLSNRGEHFSPTTNGNEDRTEENRRDGVHFEVNLTRSYSTRHPRAHRQIVLKPSPVVLKARQKVIHMLIVVVVCFAACSLPFHCRKMLQHFLKNYDNTHPAAMLSTPITFLAMYSHSAVNPLLYTLMSRRFRASLKDLVTCKLFPTAPKCNLFPRECTIKFKFDRPASENV